MLRRGHAVARRRRAQAGAAEASAAQARLRSPGSGLHAQLSCRDGHFVLTQDAPPPDRKAEEAYLKKVKRIHQAIEWILDGDPELRDAGKKTLREIGPEAIPFLEQKLADKGFGEVYGMLRELRAREAPSERAWVDGREIPTADEMEKEAPKLARDAVEKYVYAKYYEAWALSQKGRYERAVEIVQALLVLEPRSQYAEALRKLRRWCDIRITQTTVCEARAIPSKKVAVAGEKVEVRLQIRNVTKGEIRIVFPDEGQGFAVIDHQIRIPVPTGDWHEASKSEEIRFEREIAIACGGQWERTVLVDTGTGLELSQDLRIFMVQPWMQPKKVEMGEIFSMRRIVFEPAVIKVVPKKYEKDLANPLEALGRAMDSGTANDVFVTALLLEKEDQEKGIELLISAMRQSRSAEGRGFLAHLLGFMTEQKLGTDPRRWSEWWEARKKAKDHP